MDTSGIGDRTVATVLAELAKAGYIVLIPFGTVRYDLAIDAKNGERIKTVQVKTGRLVNGCITFRTFSVDRTSRERRPYHGEVDYFGVWCASYKSAFLVPVADVGTGGASLRVDPTKSAQTKGIRWAKDYLIKGL